MSADEIIKLLEFCLSAAFLSCKGKYYKQTYGTAMGSPVSVIVANLVMEEIEERAISEYPITIGRDMLMTILQPYLKNKFNSFGGI